MPKERGFYRSWLWNRSAMPLRGSPASIPVTNFGNTEVPQPGTSLVQDETIADDDYVFEDEDDEDSSDRMSPMSEDAFAASSDEFSDSGDDDFNIESEEEPEEDPAERVQFQKELPLFLGSKLTNVEASVMLTKLFLSFKLTKEVIGNILALIGLLLPEENTMPKSSYMLFKLINDCCASSPVEKVSYCKICKRRADENNESQLVCDCREPKSGEFYYMKIEHTLRAYLEHGEMHKHLKLKSPSQNGDLRDAMDGKLLRELHPVLEPFDVPLIWNTDGVRPFKSGNSEVWPLHAKPLCVPVHLRNTYRLTPIIYFGSKPPINVYLSPFVNELKTLASDGFTWKHPETNAIVTSRVYAPLCSLDAPAQAMVQGMMQFNSRFGCNVCEHQSERYTKPDTNSSSQIFMPGVSRIRTRERMANQAETAEVIGKPVNGMVMKTVVLDIPRFNVAKAFAYEYMHKTCSGTVRRFFFDFFNPFYRDRPFYLLGKIDTLEKRLKSIKPPDFVSRLHQPISQRKVWKASEFRQFLLYYSLPILRGILPQRYLEHWQLLVGAVTLMNQADVSEKTICLAEDMLSTFVADIPELYGKEFCTYNNHNLQHIGESVRRHGPLWTTGAWSFEDNNGWLTRLIRGYRYPDKQLVNLISLDLSMTVLQRQLNSQNVTSFCEKISSANIRKLSCKEVTLHGETSDNHYQCATLGNCTVSVKSTKLRDNSHVLYSKDGQKHCGKVQHFFFGEDHLPYMNVVRYEIDTCRKFASEDHAFELATIIPCYPTKTIDTILILPFNVQRCVKVLDYFCLPPNLYEINL